MKFYTFLPLISFIIIGFICSYLYAEKRKNKIDQAFLTFTGLVALMELLKFLLVLPLSNTSIKVLVKLFMFFHITFHFLFLNFVYAIINRKRDTFYYAIFTITLIAGFLGVASGTYFSKFIKSSDNLILFKNKKWIPVDILVKTIPNIIGFKLVIRKLKTSNNDFYRKPIKILLLTFVLNIIGLFITIGLFKALKLSPKLALDKYHFSALSIGMAIQAILIFIVGKKYRFLSIGLKDISKDLFMNMQDGLLFIDSNKIITHVNKKSLEILERNQFEIIDKNIAELIDEYKCPKDDVNYEIKLNVEGKEKTISVYQSCVKQKDLNMGKIIMLNDITEQKSIEKDLEASRKRYAEIMNNINIGIFRAIPNNEGTVIAEANPALLSMFEVKNKDELIISENRKIEYNNEFDNFKKCFEKIYEKEFLKNEELKTSTLKGKSFWASISAVLKKNTANDYVIDGLIEDITNKKELELEKEKLIDKLGDANDELESINDELEQTNDELTRINDELEFERNILQNRNEEMEQQIQMARKIQQTLIPASPPREYISSFYKPMELVGGDFFDFITFKNQDQIGIFLSDVSGHGVPAAFITTMIKSFIDHSEEIKNNPSELLNYLNTKLLNQSAGNFTTAFYGIYNEKDNTLTYSNAGHNDPYIIDKNGITMLSNEIKNLPLAVVSQEEQNLLNKKYTNNVIKLNKDSKLLLYTDGLVEATKSNDVSKDFQDHGINDALEKLKDQSVNNFINSLYDELVIFRGNDNFEDDVCIVCVQL